ncbi:MAG: hypothetical protein ACON4O_08610 [Lentimonas sp.]
MKWFVLFLALLPTSSGFYDLYTGESTLSSGRRGSRITRTVTKEADGQEYYGFVGIKFFTGACLFGLYQFMKRGEDTWY